MQEAILKLKEIGTPPKSVKDRGGYPVTPNFDLWNEYRDAVDSISRPVTWEEAEILIKCCPTGRMAGIEWTLLHCIESVSCFGSDDLKRYKKLVEQCNSDMMREMLLQRFKSYIIERHNLKYAEKYVKRFTTLKLIEFESPWSIWVKRFYKAFEKINLINAVPNFTKPCGASSYENIIWVLDHLSFLENETHYLIPVKLHGYLANVEIDSMDCTLNEFWEPGLNFTVASKRTKKLIHVFEAEYEYQLYIVDM